MKREGIKSRRAEEQPAMSALNSLSREHRRWLDSLSRHDSFIRVPKAIWRYIAKALREALGQIDESLTQLRAFLHYALRDEKRSTRARRVRSLPHYPAARFSMQGLLAVYSCYRQCSMESRFV